MHKSMMKLFSGHISLMDSNDFDTKWRMLSNMIKDQFAEHTAIKPIYTLLAEFFGADTEIIIKNPSLHHIALFVGEHSSLDQIHELAKHFKEKVECGEIIEFDYGPSYIAPKHYGTQGWWYSIKNNDQMKYEFFTCLDFGGWRAYDSADKFSLMSHYAIGLNSEEEVKSMLHYYSEKSTIELIAFTEKDLLGHTYGHLKNENKVMEFVFG